ncbi:uncharacterized protein LOC113468956 [Diaphorina citri]|uniref:Uncharacterized protein LOC113468956 n=1 Tax=Diaphorina citri TaxID=121845 RepID=A0A3Q0J0X9_DIACI|nr:uncharacterized protein LOC113468956 [Diaphorina citri]KAI5743928.1 hypothetical protein M8J77_023902 [Diaphorina citri]
MANHSRTTIDNSIISFSSESSESSTQSEYPECWYNDFVYEAPPEDTLDLRGKYPSHASPETKDVETKEAKPSEITKSIHSKSVRNLTEIITDTSHLDLKATLKETLAKGSLKEYKKRCKRELKERKRNERRLRRLEQQRENEIDYERPLTAPFKRKRIGWNDGRPHTVNILENNIQIRRKKDKVHFRIKLVSPNTNPRPVNTTALKEIHHDLSMKDVCQEYGLSETSLVETIRTCKRGYLMLKHKEE